MTEHNRMPARQIIVYGDCWPGAHACAGQECWTPFCYLRIR